MRTGDVMCGLCPTCQADWESCEATIRELRRRIEQLDRDLGEAQKANRQLLVTAARMRGFARQAYTHAGQSPWKGDEDDSSTITGRSPNYHCAVLYYGAKALLEEVAKE